MNKLFWIFLLLYGYQICNAQIDLECDGRDLHSIYISHLNSGEIYRIDNVDTAPTNPILVSTTPGGSVGGISINSNLDSVAGPETMYFNGIGQPYYFWNGISWTNTNHSSGSNNAVNPSGTTNYIFNLNGVGNSLYRYDGTGDGVLLLSNLNTGTAIWDLATDNIGNFYIFFVGQQKIVVFNPSGIAIDTFTTTGIISNGGGGFTILGNYLYVITLTDLYKGIQTGNNINFTLIKNIGFSVADMAGCPEAANPLSVSNHISVPSSMIYPNPFHDILNIFIDAHENFEVVIYDLISNKLLNKSFTDSITLSTEQLPKGIYLYEVRNKNGVIKVGKIVKG